MAIFFTNIHYISDDFYSLSSHDEMIKKDKVSKK